MTINFLKLKITIMKYYISLSIIILLLLSQTACQKDDEISVDEPQIELAKNTVILEEEASNELVSKSDNQLIFNKNNKSLKKIKYGDILVSSITDEAPEGYFRRITGITEMGDQIIFDTEDVKLTEAIKSCNVSFEKTFSPDDFEKNNEIEIDFEISDKFPISGQISLEPSFTFDLVIDDFHVQTANFRMDMKHTLTASMDITEGYNFEPEEVEIMEENLKPFLVFIGGVFPLIITPEFELNAGFVYNGPKLKASYNLVGDSYIQVEKQSSWHVSGDATNHYAQANVSTSIESDFEVYLKPEIDFEFYDREEVEIELFIKKAIYGEAAISDEISCKLDCGIAVGGSLEIDILGIELEPTLEAKVLSLGTFYECDNNGLTDDVNNLIPDSILQVLTDLGTPIHTGTNPPNIEGSYFVSPFILKDSNIPSDVVGDLFLDMEIWFTNQNEEELEVVVNYDQGIKAGSGIGSFIVGEGNKFTVFAELLSTHNNGSQARSAVVYSGEMTENGIKDFHLSNIVLDDFGDPYNVWIEIGEGRVLYDSDGLSENY